MSTLSEPATGGSRPSSSHVQLQRILNSASCERMNNSEVGLPPAFEHTAANNASAQSLSGTSALSSRYSAEDTKFFDGIGYQDDDVDPHDDLDLGEDQRIINEERLRAQRIYGQDVAMLQPHHQPPRGQRNSVSNNSTVLPVVSSRRSSVLRSAGLNTLCSTSQVTQVPEPEARRELQPAPNSSFPTLDVRRFAQYHTLQGLESESDRRGAARLLGIPSELRTEQEIASLATSLASVSFFKNSSEKFRKDIARFATLLEVDRHNVVLEALEDPANLFIILWGKIGNVHLGMIPDHKLRRSSTAHSHTRPSSQNAAHRPSSSLDGSTSSTLNWTPPFCAGELTPGQCFGEVLVPQVLEKDDSSTEKTEASNDTDGISVQSIAIPGAAPGVVLTPTTLVKVAMASTGLLFISRASYEELLRQEVTEDMKQKFLFCRDVCPLLVADGARENCSVRKLFAIAKELERVEVDRHSPVILQGDMSTDVYFVGQGRLQVVQAVRSATTTHPDGAPQFELVDLGEVERGWYFGEYAAFTGSARSASVYAVTPCILYKISQRGLLSTFPPLVLKAMQDFMEAEYLPIDEVEEQVKKQREWKSFKEGLVHRLKRNIKTK